MAGDDDLWRVLDRFGTPSHMAAASRANFLAAGYIVDFDSGEVAQREGEEPERLCCVVGGQMRFSSIDEAGNEVILHIGGAGTWFGHALIDGGPIMVSATAMVPTRLFVLPAYRIHRLIASDSQVALFAIRSLAGVARIALNRLKNQLALPSEAVVASLLRQLTEATPFGMADDTLHVSHSDIANMSGLSPRTVARVLQQMKRSGAIETSYASLRIVDFGALERAASAAHPESAVLL